MNNIDAQQELAFIKKMMIDSRNVTGENGLDYIVWGLLVAAGLFINYTVLTLQANPLISLIAWIAIAVNGWIFSIMNHTRCHHQAKVKTFAGKILGNLWLACGVALMIFVFVGGITHRVDPSPAVATVLGIGYFLSGIIGDSKWIKALGLVWWIGGITMFLWFGPLVHMLVMACMMVVFQVVPGIILYRKWKQSVPANG